MRPHPRLLGHLQRPHVSSPSRDRSDNNFSDLVNSDVPLRDHLSETLIPSVACELDEVYSTEPLPDDESLRQAIRRGFGAENNSRMATLLRPRQELPQHTAPDSQITPAAAPLSGAKQAQEEISHKAIKLHTAPPPQFPGATRDSKKEPTRRCALLLD